MEKKNFITLLIGVIGGVLFSLGMCMCLLPEWNMFDLGIKLGIIGIVILLINIIVYRKLSHKAPIHIHYKVILKIVYGIISALILGTGMCLIMVYEQLLYGIVIGLVGIVMLLCLIPMCLGFKEKKDLFKEEI